VEGLRVLVIWEQPNITFTYTIYIYIHIHIHSYIYIYIYIYNVRIGLGRDICWQSSMHVSKKYLKRWASLV